MPLLAAGQMNAGTMLPSSERLELRFTAIDKEIRVPVKLGGNEHDFIFDTGAPVFISKELQQRYNYPVLLWANVSDASGRQDSMAIVTVDTLRCGPFTFLGIPALVLDLGPMGAHCKNISGNLGSNAARFLNVDFDLAGQLLRLSTATDESRWRSGYSRMRLSAQSDLFAPLYINGVLVDSAHFDSGSGATCELAPEVAKRLAGSHPQMVTAHGVGITSYGNFGPGAPIEQYRLRPDSMAFGSVRVALPLCEIAGNAVSRIGRGVLRHGRLLIDYPNERFQFLPYAQPVGKERNDPGFHPVVSGSVVIVGTVWEGSAAERAGLKSGDRVVRIGDREIKSVPECELEPMLRAALDASTIRMEVEDAQGNRRSVSFRVE